MRTYSRATLLGFMAAVSMLATNALPATAQSATDDILAIKATPAAKYARYYAPYAIQAAAAYLSVKDLDDTYLKKDGDGYGADVNLAVKKVFGAVVNSGQEAVKTWQYQFGSEVYLRDCIDPSDSDCQNALRNKGWDFGAGPAFHVWARTRFPRADREVCTEVSIAFRGTVGLNRWDWLSNADRFGTPYDDYYHQLQRNIDGILTKIKGLDCYRQASHKPRIVSTGPSLGGGLAQFAALASKVNGSARISKVFAFDPSPVTGARLIKAKVRSQNGEGLTIDRIYQDGEILSYARSAIQEYPPAGSVCNPIVRTVKVDAVPGSSAFGLHGMSPLAVQIVDSSYDGNRLKTYQIPPDPTTCKNIRYNPVDEEVVASAGGLRKLVAFVPNYGGYADPLGTSSPPDVQQSLPVTKLAGIKMRRVAVTLDRHRSKGIRAAGSYKGISQVKSVALFSPPPPAL
jgi:hypothetical protein